MGEARRKGTRSQRIAESVKQKTIRQAELEVSSRLRKEHIAMREAKRMVETRHLRAPDHFEWARERVRAKRPSK